MGVSIPFRNVLLPYDRNMSYWNISKNITSKVLELDILSQCFRGTNSIKI